MTKYVYLSNIINFSCLDLNQLAQEFAQLAEQTLINSDVPHAKERVAMMNSIMKKFMAQSGMFNIQIFNELYIISI